MWLIITYIAGGEADSPWGLRFCFAGEHEFSHHGVVAVCVDFILEREMPAYLIVRAEVEEASREGFDRWYETEHLPDALRDFKAVSAMRGWSDVEPGVHLAFYEFPDLAAANAILNSDLIKEFIKEFDRHWEGKVVRTREVFEVKQSIK